MQWQIWTSHLVQQRARLVSGGDGHAASSTALGRPYRSLEAAPSCPQRLRHRGCESEQHFGVSRQGRGAALRPHVRPSRARQSPSLRRWQCSANADPHPASLQSPQSPVSLTAPFPSSCRRHHRRHARGPAPSSRRRRAWPTNVLTAPMPPRRTCWSPNVPHTTCHMRPARICTPQPPRRAPLREQGGQGWARARRRTPPPARRRWARVH
jgi:hypothetical protein